MAKMTERQKKFCNEYLIDLNVTQAAIRAGYTAKYADKRAYGLLDKPEIKEYIEKRMQAREKRTEITQDMVLKELAAIAFTDGSKYAKVIEKNAYDEKGNPVINPETGEILRYKAIAFKNTDELTDIEKKAISGIHKGKDGMRVETYDKLKALELLGKHLGMFKDKVELSGSINNPFEGLTTEQLLKIAGVNDE